MIERAKSDGQIEGVILHLVDGGLSILQYADDTKGDSEKCTSRPAKSNVLCRPKDQGGPRIQDLKVKNRALIGKWLFKLLTGDGIWQTLLRRKYMD
jgi:hypothetical protein